MDFTKKIAIVGTPCQILATTKINNYNKETGGSPIDVKIGLFCMENFSYTYLRKFLEEKEIDINEIAEFRIENNLFKLFLNNGQEKSFTLEETESFKRNNCEICVDFASDLSDISVGSVGSPKGYSTLIVRTEKGQNIINKAISNDYISAEKIPSDSKELAILNKIATNKKEENLKNIKTRENSAHPVLYKRKISNTEIAKLSNESQFDNLNKDILSEGACVLCGACEFVCPENIIKIGQRKPNNLENKNKHCLEGCHACYYACPRTFLSEDIRPQELDSKPIGDYLDIYSAKSNITEKGQDGGVVTSLLLYLLEEKIVDEVFIVDEDKNNPWKPVSKLTNNPELVKKSAGTKYSTIPIAFKALQND
ncbi:MAG: Coenzyme F420 hydrogenase/dehydrogenase, beta subunit C-terminal domain [Methanobrevibacter sp.]|jgi:coenzyme F420 hydrogenase subunit beta|nr:Coenzyme F420 hydrogenase/dehydrogenase, beta subunit C-terminal domain [Methanobrevibacter sp.]